jgi:hypothetical protein
MKMSTTCSIGEQRLSNLRVKLNSLEIYCVKVRALLITGPEHALLEKLAL